MSSNSSNLPTTELSFHHGSILPEHRSGSEPLAQIHSKDGGASTHRWNFKLEGEHGDIAVFPLNYFTLAKFSLREFSMRFHWDFDSAPNAIYWNFQEPEGLSFFKINQIISKTERIFLLFYFLVVPNSLLFVC